LRHPPQLSRALEPRFASYPTRSSSGLKRILAYPGTQHGAEGPELTRLAELDERAEHFLEDGIDSGVEQRALCGVPTPP